MNNLPPRIPHQELAGRGASAVTEAIADDLKAQDVKLIELHIDRAYLNSHFLYY
jgi:hypothetical protein